MSQLIWIVFLVGVVVAQLFGGWRGRGIYFVAVLVVILLFRRPLAIALTHVAARLGLMRETIARMPDEIHLVRAAAPEETARPALRLLAASGFDDAGAWNIAELPKIKVALMVHATDGMLGVVETAAPVVAQVNVHTLYPDGRIATFTNSELPPPPSLRPNCTRVRVSRLSAGALVLRARRERPADAPSAISAAEAPRIYERLYADEMRFRKERGA
jgi:hypothetical protein